MNHLTIKQGFTAIALWLAIMVAHASQPLTVPHDVPVYSAPMATIVGSGAMPFHVTLGMLVTAAGTPVGLYRSYPSKSSTPMSEQYGLGMLGTPDGVILASYKNIPILVLHGHIGERLGIYPLSVAYLASNAPRHYSTCTLHVEHTPQGRWATVDATGHPITTFVVVSHRFGISHIEHCGR